MGEITPELERLLDKDSVCTWETLEETSRQRLQRAIAGNPPACIVYPKTSETLATVMATCHRQGWRVLPMGNGSKLHWGGVVEDVEVVVSTKRLDRIVEHAVGDLTLTVEAGATLHHLNSILAQSRQFLALDPSYPDDATLGGIVATGDMGSWRQRYNSVRDRLIGISFVRSDGEIVKAGGRVVKNVAGYDLMKLLTGSYGTLAIATQLTFRLYPIPETSATIALCGEAEAIASVAQTILTSALTPTAIDLLSPGIVKSLELESGFGVLVRFQSVAESVQQQIDRVRELGETLGLTATSYRDDAEAKSETDLWERSRILIETDDPETRVLGKIGIRPTSAVAALQYLNEQFRGEAIAVVHAGCGLGRVRVPTPLATTSNLLNLRNHLQNNSGFLTILEAPQSLKRQLDVWGYVGNAQTAMQQIKAKFDPQNRLSPKRFIV
ncbi:Glycolate dehydrogenase FAD-binding subunit GlcE [Geitlerinema sp. FC II]|nr:Glycolate dehydrogenase FAD-binding subunit GlcE [Geitlerinema sp. FC II]